MWSTREGPHLLPHAPPFHPDDPFALEDADARRLVVLLKVRTRLEVGEAVSDAGLATPLRPDDEDLGRHARPRWPPRPSRFRRAVGARWVKSRDKMLYSQHAYSQHAFDNMLTDNMPTCHGAVLLVSQLYFSRSPTAPQLTQYSSGSTRPPKMSKRMPASVLRRTEERAGKRGCAVLERRA